MTGGCSFSVCGNSKCSGCFPTDSYAITSEVTKNSVQNGNSIDLETEIDAVQIEIIAEETNGRDLLC